MMVPDEWARKSIGDICDFTNGNGFKPSEWAEHGLPIIRIQNLNGSSEFNYFDGEPKEKWLVKPGDILFAWAGTKGVSFGAKKWNGPKGVLNQHIFKVHPRPGLDPDWLYLALQRLTQRVEAKGHGFKSTLLHVQKSDITGQGIGVPPLSEQRKIAQILSTWDAAITANERLLENSQERKKALMQQLLTGKRRLIDVDNGAGTQPTRTGEIPADWKYTKIGAICSQFSEKNAKDEKLPVLSCSKHIGFVDSLSYFKKKVYSDDLTGYRVIQRGCIGFPANHIEEGSIGLQNIYDRALVSPIYVIAKPNLAKVNSEYLYAVLKTDHYRQIFSAATNASVDRRGSLRWKEFSLIRVPLPSLFEQKNIVSILGAAENEIGVIKRKLSYLKQEKKALMQQLLTGKRRILVDCVA